MVPTGIRALVFGRAERFDGEDIHYRIFYDESAEVRHRKLAALRIIEVCGATSVELTEFTTEAVRLARESGATWDEVAAQLGVSRQAASQRFGGKINGHGTDPL